MQSFDLLEEQQKARELVTPERLYTRWSYICDLYDKRQISEYDLEEMKAVIFTRLRELSNIKDQMPVNSGGMNI